MKALWKTLLFGLLAAALALGVRYIYVQGSALMDRDGGTWDSDALVAAKNFFMNKLDEVQILTAALVEEPPESFLPTAEGEILRLRDGEKTPLTGEEEALFRPLMLCCGEGGEVLHVEIVPEAVIFYTAYGEGGCVGFLYEKELDETDYFDEYLEIVENWKLFFRLGK